MALIDSMLPAHLVHEIFTERGICDVFALLPHVSRGWRDECLALLASMHTLDLIAYSRGGGCIPRYDSSKYDEHSAMGNSLFLGRNLTKLLRACTSLEVLKLEAEILYVPRRMAEFGDYPTKSDQLPLVVGSIRCPTLKKLQVVGACCSEGLCDIAKHSPLLEEMLWSQETEFCNMGWRFDVRSLKHIKKSCPALKQLPALWAVDNTSELKALMKLLATWGSLEKVTIVPAMNEFEEVIDAAMPLAAAPGNFSGTLHIEGCYERACTEWPDDVIVEGQEEQEDDDGNFIEWDMGVVHIKLTEDRSM